MRNIILIIIGTLCFGSLSGQTFQRFLDRLNSLPEPQRQAVVDSFMNAVQIFPYTEMDTVVHFVYFQNAQTVTMAGDATEWVADKSFTRISGCTFWYYTTSYEADARLDYKLVIDGTNWILDPKNPYTCMGGFGPNSELRMPAYAVAPETAYYGNIPHGTLMDTVFHSNFLGNNRTVTIYLPPGYNTGNLTYPVILFHDGPDYITLGKTNNILDYLISKSQIVPVIGVFVPPVDRTAEYAGNKIDLFTRFIIEELMPVIDARYRTSMDSSKRAMAGASNGGNISLYIGMKHPGKFGKIAAQSSNVINSINNTFASGPKLNLELYLDIGTYDLAELIPMVRNLRNILEAKNYLFQYFEWHEGHSWGNWSGHLKLPLIQFFSSPGGFNQPTLRNDIRLEQNRPNPFFGQTTIPFLAPAGEKVELILSDMSGRMIETIYSGSVSTSNNSLEYYHRQNPGQFICTLRSAGYQISRIITSIR